MQQPAYLAVGVDSLLLSMPTSLEEYNLVCNCQLPELQPGWQLLPVEFTAE